MTTALTSLWNATVAVQNQTVTGVDAGGQPTSSWQTASSVSGRIEPAGGREFNVKQQLVRVDAICYLQAGTTVTERSRLVVTSSPSMDGTYAIRLVSAAPLSSGSNHVEALIDRWR